MRGEEDRKAQRDKEAAEQREREKCDMEATMALPAARRVLLRLLRYTGVVMHDVSAFDKNALIMAQNEGIQRVGRWVLSEISSLAPADYLTILQENLEEERRLTAQAQSQGDDDA